MHTLDPGNQTADETKQQEATGTTEEATAENAGEATTATQDAE